MKKDLGVYLEDILESINRIEEYTKNLTFQDFEESTQVQDAVFRRFEVLGEAVKRLPDEYKEKYPEIEWRNAAGTRDVLIHEYAEVSLERIWNTIKDDLPTFKKQIEALPEL